MKPFARMILVSSLALAAVIVVAAVGVARSKGMSVHELAELGLGVVAARTSRHTVEDRVATIIAKKPHLKAVAKSAGGKLRILVFKNERMVELHAPGWKAPRKCPMTAFSGTLGPKLREGDGQIPEGVYGIEYLNPNSSYYLSLKVTYPNASDRARAKVDGRTNLGGDIMIHGKAVTIGCVPVGDDAIEDIFYLAYAVGIKNVLVVIAPYDMRSGRNPELEESSIAWYPDLCMEIAAALSDGNRASAGMVQPSAANGVDLAAAARKQVGVTVGYDSAYRKLAYPNGDVPRESGVCTDVIIRALRDARKIDLQKLVHEDMKTSFSKYPQMWGLKAPDANIDHRRVPNLQCYFKRKGYALPVSKNAADYKPGDIVTVMVGGKLPHIMIVSDRKSAAGVPLAIHNIGSGTQEEDVLFAYPLTGHYRIP